MWRTQDEIILDLYSKNPTRLEAAINDLKERMDDFDEFELPPLKISLLDVFGDDLSEEIQHSFFRLITEYESFVPKLSFDETIETVIQLILRYGNGFIILQAKLFFIQMDNPQDVLTKALDYLFSSNLDSPARISAAQDFLSYLLDNYEIARSVTLNYLRPLAKRVEYEQVVQYIIPQLEETELKMLYSDI